MVGRPYYPTPVFDCMSRWRPVLCQHILLLNLPSKLTATRLLTRIHDVLSGNILAISEPLLLHRPRSQSAAVSLSQPKNFGIFATSLLHSPNNRFVVGKREFFLESEFKHKRLGKLVDEREFAWWGIA